MAPLFQEQSASKVSDVVGHPDVGEGGLLKHAPVLEAEGIKEGGPGGKVRHLTDGLYKNASSVSL